MENRRSTELGGVNFEVGDAYKVLGPLGQGTFGVVAAGLETGTGEKVAIKRVHPIVAASPLGARHILREIITMRILRCHPNIINIEDICEDEQSSTLYVVMELMDCDLRRVLASGQVLTTAHVQTLLKQLLLGVQAMHCHDILHRDLKPVNILLLDDCQLRITDFGLSGRAKISSPGQEKQFVDGTVDDDSTSTGYVVTTWYRAPEMILGSEGKGGKPLDMWSVGCIFGEMLGSRGPLFPGKNFVDQVSVMLAAMGKPDTARRDSLGYELSDDAVQLLKTVEPPTGENEPHGGCVWESEILCACLRKGKRTSHLLDIYGSVLDGVSLTRRSLKSLVPDDVDEKTLDLLKALLDMNVQRRMTVVQALEHLFLRDCPRLPTADDATDRRIPAVEKTVEYVDKSTVEFSFEDENLTVEELGKLIAAEATLYKKKNIRTSCRHSECLEADAPPSLQPLRPPPDLQEILRMVRTQACRYQDSKDEMSAMLGANAVDSDVSTLCRLRSGIMSHTGAALDTRFSSLANLAGAEGRGVDGLRGSFSNGINPDLQMGSVSGDITTKSRRDNENDRSRSTPGCSTGVKRVDAEVGGAEQPQTLDDGIGTTVKNSDKLKRARSSEILTEEKTGKSTGEMKPGEEDVSTARPPQPAPSEEVSALRRAATSPPRPRPSQPPNRNADQPDGYVEEERAANVIQRSHRQAAAIRRARAEQEQNLQAQQFLFGPGFQQPACRTARRSGSESGRYSERRERSRDVASLTPSEEEVEGENSNSRAATKIQAHARRKAASRRAVEVRQRKNAAAKKETAGEEPVPSVPRLPIESSALSSAFSFRRCQTASPKVQREPLAILRQLRDNPDVQPAPKTDQFRLRMTIKSAIEAHIKKTGAPRRKPHPLPTALTYRQNAALMKLKSQQQQQQLRAEATRVPLTKRRAISPLHRSVRQVNTFIAATDKGRGQPTAGPGPRAQSAPPSRATDRLRCAIHAAETMVEREYERAQRRPSLQRERAPVDELSRDLLASPLFVPYSPPA